MNESGSRAPDRGFTRRCVARGLRHPLCVSATSRSRRILGVAAVTAAVKDSGLALMPIHGATGSTVGKLAADCVGAGKYLVLEAPRQPTVGSNALRLVCRDTVGAVSRPLGPTVERVPDVTAGALDLAAGYAATVVGLGPSMSPSVQSVPSASFGQSDAPRALPASCCAFSQSIVSA